MLIPIGEPLKPGLAGSGIAVQEGKANRLRRTVPPPILAIRTSPQPPAGPPTALTR